MPLLSPYVRRAWRWPKHLRKSSCPALLAASPPLDNFCRGISTEQEPSAHHMWYGRGITRSKHVTCMYQRPTPRPLGRCLGNQIYVRFRGIHFFIWILHYCINVCSLSWHCQIHWKVSVRQAQSENHCPVCRLVELALSICKLISQLLCCIICLHDQTP
jgi:hypothetical protein